MATAAHFARSLLDTNPTIESQARTARQVMQAAERNMTDATTLNYDFRNPFVICGSTYVPIYKGQKDVACPYCTARFVPSQEGNICSVCDLAVIGADASGLLCSASQVRWTSQNDYVLQSWGKYEMLFYGRRVLSFWCLWIFRCNFYYSLKSLCCFLS